VTAHKFSHLSTLSAHSTQALRVSRLWFAECTGHHETHLTSRNSRSQGCRKQVRAWHIKTPHTVVWPCLYSSRSNVCILVKLSFLLKDLPQLHICSNECKKTNGSRCLLFLPTKLYDLGDGKWIYNFVTFEVFTAVTVKNGVFLMLRRVAHVRTNVSEERSSSFIRVTRIFALGITLAGTSNRLTLRRNTKWWEGWNWGALECSPPFGLLYQPPLHSSGPNYWLQI
jgi:hypothetical protein